MDSATNIFLWRSCFTNICHNEEAGHAIKCSQISLSWSKKKKQQQQQQQQQTNRSGRSGLILLLIDEAGNFQVVVIRREKNSSVYLNNFTNFFNTDAFFHFLWKMPAYLVADAKPVLCAEQSIMLLAIGKMFLNLNFISNNFQETYDLNFDRFSNYLYLFKKSA